MALAPAPEATTLAIDGKPETFTQPWPSNWGDDKHVAKQDSHVVSLQRAKAMHATPGFTGDCNQWQQVLHTAYDGGSDSMCAREAEDVLAEMSTYKQVRTAASARRIVATGCALGCDTLPSTRFRIPHARAQAARAQENGGGSRIAAC